MLMLRGRPISRYVVTEMFTVTRDVDILLRHADARYSFAAFR